MNNPKVKLLVLISLLAALAAAISAFATGSHLQIGFNDAVLGMAVGLPALALLVRHGRGALCRALCSFAGTT